jgi:membrane associated rhomboid family serine protease
MGEPQGTRADPQHAKVSLDYATPVAVPFVLDVPRWLLMGPVTGVLVGVVQALMMPVGYQRGGLVSDWAGLGIAGGVVGLPYGLLLMWFEIVFRRRIPTKRSVCLTTLAGMAVSVIGWVPFQQTLPGAPQWFTVLAGLIISVALARRVQRRA